MWHSGISVVLQLSQNHTFGAWSKAWQVISGSSPISNLGLQLVAHSKPQRAPLWDQECKLYCRWGLSIFIEWKTVQLKTLNVPCIIFMESCSWRLGSDSPKGKCSVFTARLGLPGRFIPIQLVTACDKMAWESVSLVIQTLRCVRQLLQDECKGCHGTETWEADGNLQGAG